jgi:hypothetical protein
MTSQETPNRSFRRSSIGTPILGWRSSLTRIGASSDRRRRLRQAQRIVDQVEGETPTEAFWRQFRAELERSRRHDRQLSLLRLGLAAGHPDRGNVAWVTRQAFRCGDGVLVESDQLLVLLSEAGRAEAMRVIERLSPADAKHTAAFRWETIVFPEDALTLHAMLEHVYSDAESRPGR